MTWPLPMRRRVQAWRALTGLALLWFSGAAMALGLGEIRVKSQPGQPLLAEIPIISSEPGELEQLQARLASPDTFERVGLPRPQGLINGLGFAVALDDLGKPVIRVTSAEPVQVAGLNFLIEVDWGQGRLVREYSALVDAPGALASGGQPVIDAPLPAPANMIIRDPAPAATPGAGEGLAPRVPAPMQASAATATPASAPATGAATAGQVLVGRGQALSTIARQLSQGHSLDQTMLALLRVNPEAFIGGNINRLKQGAVLRVPPTAELAQLSEADASALVREQIAQWRQARRPLPQPPDAGILAPDAVATAPVPAVARVAEARLEIAPPAAAATTRAGTQSGINAEGEGNMLATQQLTLAQEELAAREAEVQELRGQVAELESLKQQQSKLIALKDSELAAAQQRLAQSQGDAAQPLWLWAGLGLLAAALVVAWLISRRRARQPAPLRSRYDPAALAAAIPAVAEDDALAASAPVQSTHEIDHSQVPAVAIEPESTPGPMPKPAVALPAWTAAATRPTWHIGEVSLNVAPLNPAPAGRERLERAIAYLDLGDIETARELLNEVLAGDDAAARNEAAQLLRDLD